MSSEYCKPEDLLLGDLGGVEDMSQRYIDLAANEMDSMIGYVYILPLPFTGLPVHQQLILTNIALKLASGRLILAQAVGSEDSAVHAYGKSLIDEAMRDLWAIRNQTIDLTAPKVEGGASVGGDAPVILEGDLYSGVDSFYDWMSNPARQYFNSPIWRPGS